MTLKILLWLLVPIGKAVVDWYIIERLKKPVDHLIESIFVGMAMILYGAFVFDAQAGTHGAMVIVYEVSSYYIFFELALNALRRKPLDYLGKTALTDRILSRHRWLYWTLKAACAAGMIVSAIYLMKYE